MRQNFPRAIVLASVLPQAAGCAHVAADQATDLVVVGRATTLLSEGSMEVLDEWGLNVRFTARLRVSRVIRGRPPSSRLTIRYVAHDTFNVDHRSEFHLRRAEDGTWLLCADDSGIGYICR